MEGIVIKQAALNNNNRGLIIQGFLSLADIERLRVDSYQREQLSAAKIQALMNAMLSSDVPTIELGMRGSNATNRGATYTLHDPTYIIDGFQRVTAAIQILRNNPKANIRLSVIVHLETDFDWELERFTKLNLGQTKIAGTITLRNLRHELSVVETLIKLCENDKAFPLYGRVSWQQDMPRSALITAVTLSKVVGNLHAHIGPGRGNNVINLARGLDKIMSSTGKSIFVGNVKTFYDVIDKAWGVKTVAYRASANQLKATFMVALAGVFSNHLNFWDGNKLVVDEQTIKKLAQFPMTDPTVASLCSGGGSGQGAVHLGILIKEHLDRGRRTNRLVTRVQVESLDDEDSDVA